MLVKTYKLKDLNKWWPTVCPECGNRCLSCYCGGGTYTVDGDCVDVHCLICNTDVDEDRYVRVGFWDYWWFWFKKRVLSWWEKFTSKRKD